MYANVLGKKEKTQAKEEQTPSDLSSHNLTAEEFAKLQNDLGELPSAPTNQKPDLISTPNQNRVAPEAAPKSRWKREKKPKKDSKTPMLLSPRTIQHKATESAIQDVPEGCTGSPRTTPRGSRLVKSTTLKKVMRVTGRTTAAAAATILAVPASITGAIIGGARGAHRGPTALVTGTVVGAAAGGASVFKSFKVIGRKKED